ncbi:serine hydrolase domain-containing protein [Lactiplantibacillus pingfangensis]|uniref:serine hydrolase domain-containing protein n=1 Tax=Lactiplantibacillus pingfangensis TaxID=2559915 RepID=UPI0010F50AD2|nr:serine hydrolase domain-containing protein [Lactiplantibacillus pingfangensis]
MGLKRIGIGGLSLLLGLLLWPISCHESLAKVVYVTIPTATVRTVAKVPMANQSADPKQTVDLPAGQLYLGTLHANYLKTRYLRLTTLAGQRLGWVARQSVHVLTTIPAKSQLQQWSSQNLNGRLRLGQAATHVVVTAGGPIGTVKAKNSWTKSAEQLTRPEFQVIRRVQTPMGRYYLLQRNQHNYGWVSAASFHYETTSFQQISATTWRRIDQLIKAQGIQGTLLVAQAGKAQPNIRSYGLADRQTRRPNAAATVYPIASLQKAMTGVMIGQLIAQHRLSLQTTLKSFYPQLKGASQITIQQLLNHTSGIWMPEVAPPKSLSEAAAIRWNLQHLTSTGEHRWHYCSANYTLLAGIIRQATGKSYATNLTQRILRPAGMTQTMTWNQFGPEKVATPYLPDGTPATISTPLLSSELGAGDIGTTVTDYFRFVAAFNQGVFLSTAMQRQLTAVRTNTYAAGLYYGTDGAQHATGFDNNISNFYSRSAAGDATVVLFMNQGNHYRAKLLVHEIMTLIESSR